MQFEQLILDARALDLAKMGKRAAATRATERRIMRRSTSVKAFSRRVRGHLQLALGFMPS
jgi:hypothetical protein